MAVSKWNAILRFHYKVEPESLSDDQWAKLVQEYRYVNHRAGLDLQDNLRIVLYELATAIYGKNE